MRETKSKKLTLEPITNASPLPPHSGKEGQTAKIVDANDLFDPDQALATSRPLLPSLAPDPNGTASGGMSGGKLAIVDTAACREEGLKTVDPFNNAMSKNGYVPPRSLQLDENVFTFRPKVSSASAKIAEGLGTDFMSRQQIHLEKQKRLVSDLMKYVGILIDS